MTSWYQRTNRFADPRGARRIAQFIDVLGRFPVGHLVDIGAGHGVFAQIAADLGWRVTAVDVRAERFFDGKDFTWVVADVRDFDGYEDADVVACLGLWYHLTLEDQLALGARIAPRPLILDTHVAVAHPSDEHRARLSDVLVRDGYAGRLYDESDLQHSATASWGNAASFWPTVASLEMQMYASGYELFEQLGPPYRRDRAFFLARALGDDTYRAELDRKVSRYVPMTRPDVAPDPGRLPVLVPQLDPPRPAATTRPADRVLPVRTAGRQFLRAARASGRRRVARVRSRLARD